MGKSLIPLINGNDISLRSFAFSGRYSRSVSTATLTDRSGKKAAMAFDGWTGTDAVSEPFTVTSDDWTLIFPPAKNGKPELYNIKEDPNQTVNVFDKNIEIAKYLHSNLIEFLKKSGMPDERMKEYLWNYENESYIDHLNGSLDSDTTLYYVKNEGHVYAYLNKSELQMSFPKARPDDIKSTSLKELSSLDPKALVNIGHQYFWPSDICSVL